MPNDTVKCQRYKTIIIFALPDHPLSPFGNAYNLKVNTYAYTQLYEQTLHATSIFYKLTSLDKNVCMYNLLRPPAKIDLTGATFEG